MSIQFSRMIGGSPYTGNITDQPYRAPVNGLAVDADGTLYVKLMSTVGSHGNSGLWPWAGPQVRPPGPVSQDPSPLCALNRSHQGSRLRPVDSARRCVHSCQSEQPLPVFYSFGDELLNRMVDGQIVFINGRQRQICFFKVDGSNALRTCHDVAGSGETQLPHLAQHPGRAHPPMENAPTTPTSPAPPTTARRRPDIDPNWPQGRVYRHDLTNPQSTPEAFFRSATARLPAEEILDAQRLGQEDGRRRHRRGFRRQRARGRPRQPAKCVEIAPDGKKLSATSLPWPDKVIVSRKRGRRSTSSAGAVSRRRYAPRRSSTRSPDAVTRRKSKPNSRCRAPSAALLPLTRPARRRSSGSAVGGGTVARRRPWRTIRDHRQGLPQSRSGDAIAFVGYMDVDPEAELVYVTGSGNSICALQMAAAEPAGCCRSRAVDLAIGPGGMIYTWVRPGRLSRPDRTLHARPQAGAALVHGQAHLWPTRRGAPAAAPASAAWMSTRAAGSTPSSAPTSATCASYEADGHPCRVRPHDHPTRWRQAPRRDLRRGGLRLRLRRQCPPRSRRQHLTSSNTAAPKASLRLPDMKKTKPGAPRSAPS